MNFLKPKGIVAVGLLTASVAMLGFSSGSSAEESSLTPELKAELQALIDSYRGEPEFVAPGDPIDIKAALGGKLIYGISVTSANPFTEGIYTSIRKLEPIIGFEFKDWQNQGSLAEHQRGISQAKPHHRWCRDHRSYGRVGSPALGSATRGSARRRN